MKTIFRLGLLCYRSELSSGRIQGVIGDLASILLSLFWVKFGIISTGTVAGFRS